MRNAIRTGSLFAAAALFVGIGSPAHAAPPAGTCPGPFEAYTLVELLVLAESVHVPSENARNLFETVNKNRDDRICVQDQTSEKKPDKFNFIDNNKAVR